MSTLSGEDVVPAMNDSSISVIHDSALEIEHDISLLKDPHLLAVNTEGIRRRASEFNRPRPTNLTVDIELTPLPSVADPKLSPTSEIFIDDVKQRAAVDLELAPGPSLPQSAAVSVNFLDEGDSASTAPILTPAEKATQRRWSRIHFAALCWAFFLAGWNDGSTGPLLPTIQKSHNIGFAIVSLLFVVNTVGYIVGAVSNVYLTDKYGFGKILALGSMVQLTAYALLASGGPFPVMCTAFGLIGFAMALEITQGNSLVGSLKENASTKLGFLHASYGLGAFTAPLVATHFASQVHWSFHYLISTCLAVLNCVVQCTVFRFKTADAIKAEGGELMGEQNASASDSKYKQIMSIRAVHFLSCWTLIYVGVEVTLGGWIVTFIQQRRDGGASAGYISSGFFGGLMMGRILLMWLNQKIGEHRVMFIYGFLAIVLEVTVWVVPSLIENAIAVSCIGLLIGPMYPILVHHSSMILPRVLYTGCIGWISGIGQTGSAILPFITGLLASKFGISSLQPFIVSMMSTMIILWAFVPRVRRID